MTDVLMPQMGESVTEGTVTRWLKRVGEHVERDEPLLEISTDKVDAEIPAPATGQLSEIVVVEGATVAVGTVLGHVVAAQDQPNAAHAETASAAVAQPAPPAALPAPPAVPAPAPAAPPEPPPASDAETEELRRTRSSPLVRRMAEEHSVDLGNVRGTGIDGRVTRQDLQNFLAESGAGQPVPPGPAPAAAPVPAPPSAPAAPPPSHAPEPAHPAPPPPTAPPPTVVSHAEVAHVETFLPPRRRAAEQLVASRRIAAHATTIFEIDLTLVERAREARARSYQPRGVPMPTCLPLVLHALSHALRAHPLLNASLDERGVVHHKYVNLGVAVPLERGAVVPVIKQAETKSVFDLARELADLSERARSRRLRLDEVQSATFSVSEAGAGGSLVSLGTIQQPQTATLAIGTAEKRAVVIGDAIAVRSMAFFALTFDQRLVDPADAERFMGQLKRTLVELDETIA